MRSKFLCFFINYVMKGPFTLARTVPKFDGIVVILLEELSKFTRNCC